MPPFVNENDHPIYVAKPNQIGDEKLVQIVPGQVVEADGEYADNLSATAGVRSAGSADQARWDALRAPTSGVGSRIAAKAALGDARNELRVAVTVAPLQRVVGDDQAPLGPPSGVVLTKSEAAAAGPAEREAFGGNAALAGDAKLSEDGAVDPRGEPTSAVIHNAQVDGANAAEAKAKEFIADPDAAAAAAGHEPQASTSEPESASEPASDLNVARATKPQLEAEAARRNVSVKGTGQDGNVTVKDLRAALS